MSPFYLAFRYSFSPNNRHRAKAIKIALGMLLSTLALLVTLSVMDFLQNSRFVALKTVKSFPIVVETEERLENASFTYKEMPALLTSSSGVSQAVMVRFIDESYNGGLPNNFESSLEQGALVGLAYFNKLKGGAKLSYLDEGKVARRTLRATELKVSGYYRTLLGSSFDSNYIFLPISSAPEYLKTKVAILEDDAALVKELRAKGYKVTSWQESEATLYDAMMLERLLMIFIISFLFLIILVQTNTNARLFIEAKKGEIVTLWTLGLSRRKCALAFALSGFFVAFLGCALGFMISFPVLRIVPDILSLGLTQALYPDLSISMITTVIISFLSAMLYYTKSLKVMRQTEEVLHE